MRKFLFYTVPLVLCFLLFWGLSKHPTDKSLVECAEARRGAYIAGAVVDAGAACSGNYGLETTHTSSIVTNIFCAKIELDPACSGTVTEAHAYISYCGSGNTAECEFALYDDTSASDEPGNFIGQYGAFDQGSGGEYWFDDTSINQVISGDPSNIWLCLAGEYGDFWFETTDCGTACAPTVVRNETYAIGGTSGDDTNFNFPSDWETDCSGSCTEITYTDREVGMYVVF